MSVRVQRRNEKKSCMFPPQRRDAVFLSFPIQQDIPSVHLMTVQTQNKVA